MSTFMFTFAIYGRPDSRVTVYANIEAEGRAKATAALEDTPALVLVEAIEVGIMQPFCVGIAPDGSTCGNDETLVGGLCERCR